MRDLEKQKAWRKRRRDEYIAKKYGPEFVGQSMIGKHGNQARGRKNGRWGGGKWVHQDGYIAVAVPVGHHLRMKNGYAYVHQIEAEKMIGRRLKKNETVHHIDGNVTNNKHDNLLVSSRKNHALLHAIAAKRNKLGQFVPGLKRVREMPEVKHAG